MSFDNKQTISKLNSKLVPQFFRSDFHILFCFLASVVNTDLSGDFSATEESRFYEPPREMKIGSKNRRVRVIGGNITVFD